MKRILLFSLTGLIVVFSLSSCISGAGESFLSQEYDLIGERSAEPQYYHMERVIVFRADDGTRQSVERYNLRLMVEPDDQSAAENAKYTCAEVTMQKDDEPEVTIPALAGWSHDHVRGTGIDEQGLLFGVPDTKFQGLTNSNGEVLEPIVAYQIKDVFVGFHSFTALAERNTEDKGFQKLKRIGDKIVDESAGVETAILEGSTFKNGEVTVEFKGLSVADGATSAILHVDSGDGSFIMAFSHEGMEIKTVGGTHYWADIYLDLESKWVKKSEVTVVDMTKTTTGDQVLDTTVVETTTLIKAVPEAEF
ncbi:hypothetical protein ACFLYF_05800 [Chloroflexota bacterium]